MINIILTTFGEFLCIESRKLLFILHATQSLCCSFYQCSPTTRPLCLVYFFLSLSLNTGSITLIKTDTVVLHNLFLQNINKDSDLLSPPFSTGSNELLISSMWLCHCSAGQHSQAKPCQKTNSLPPKYLCFNSINKTATLGLCFRICRKHPSM